MQWHMPPTSISTPCTTYICSIPGAQRTSQLELLHMTATTSGPVIKIGHDTSRRKQLPHAYNQRWTTVRPQCHAQLLLGLSRKLSMSAFRAERRPSVVTATPPTAFSVTSTRASKAVEYALGLQNSSSSATGSPSPQPAKYTSGMDL